MLIPFRKILDKIKANPIYLYIILYFGFLVILALVRNASADETYYLKETVLISELLRKGIWIGDYGVGLHGFLFKLPVAIVYLITDIPSVFVATFSTIIISISSLILFYKIAKKYFMNQNYAFWSTVLFSVMFHFMDSSITFNRDIAAVFAVLLFIYLFLKESNMWFIGLSFLLMLDAKEHVFLTVAPLYLVYLMIHFFQSLKNNNNWKSIKEFISKCFSGYILSLVWVVLMFTTSIIPINMFVASISGFIQTGITWSKEQFSVEAASQNLMEGAEKEIILFSDVYHCNSTSDSAQNTSETTTNSIGTSNTDENVTKVENEQDGENNTCSRPGMICNLVKVGDIIMSYIGKALYPRTFSFISVPKIIVLPAIMYSIPLLVKWLKAKDKKMILPMILLFNVAVLLLRASHGRYLLCVTPIFVIFFIMFLRDCIKRPKYFRNVLIATTIFVLLGLIFETTFFVPKAILEIVLLILFWGVWFLRNKKKKPICWIKYLFLLGLAGGMFFAVLADSYKIGQISSYLKYGYDRETEKIAAQVDNEEKIWINDYGSEELINFARKDLYNNPEWNWNLASQLPKKKLLKIYQPSNTFSFDILSMSDFREKINVNEIKKVVLIVSTYKKEKFSYQEKLEQFSSFDWLQLKNKIELENKIMYIFEVEN